MDQFGNVNENTKNQPDSINNSVIKRTESTN